MRLFSAFLASRHPSLASRHPSRRSPLWCGCFALGLGLALSGCFPGSVATAQQPPTDPGRAPSPNELLRSVRELAQSELAQSESARPESGQSDLAQPHTTTNASSRMGTQESPGLETLPPPLEQGTDTTRVQSDPNRVPGAPVLASDPLPEYWDTLSQEVDLAHDFDDATRRLRRLLERERERRSQIVEQLLAQPPIEIPSTSPPTAGTDEPSLPVDSTSEPASSETDADAALPSDTSAFTDAMVTQRITEVVPDQRALADTLFSAGQTQLALENYTRIYRTVPEARKDPWIQYQIAACQRRLGNSEDASSRLREVAERDMAMLGEASQWWQDAMKQKDNLESELQIIENFVRHLSAAEGEERAEADGQDNSDIDAPQ